MIFQAKIPEMVSYGKHVGSQCVIIQPSCYLNLMQQMTTVTVLHA